MKAAETSADDDNVMARAAGLRRPIARLVEVTQAYGKSRP